MTMMEFNDNDLRILSYGLYLAKNLPGFMNEDKINELYDKINEKLDGKKPLFISRKDAQNIVNILEANLDSGDSEMDRDIKHYIEVLTNNVV